MRLSVLFTAKATHWLAGRRSLAAVSRLLGLDETDRHWALDALCALEGENVRLALRAGKARLVLHVLPKGSKRSRVEARRCSLGVEAEPGPAVRRFLDVVASRLGERSMEDVLGVIVADPESFGEETPAGLSPVTLRVPMAAGPIGLLDAGWRNFFADQDFEVLLGYPELGMNKTLYARYSDRECLYSWSGNDPRKWSFFAYPMRVPSDSFGAAVFRKGIVMELAERDMVLGTNEKADAMVESVVEKASGSDAEYVVLNHFCTTVVLGEDAEAVTSRLGKASGRTAVSWSHNDRDRLDNFGRFFRDLFARPGFFDAAADAGAVNLFHFPTDYREAELVPWLTEMGVRVNLRLFPDVDFSGVESLARASAQVFCEASSYQAKLKEALAGRPRPVLEVRAPFGIAATRECARAIAAAAGRGDAFEEAWARRYARIRPGWEAMREQARDFRLAFVVSETTLPRLWQVRHGQGAPLMRMIGEMGFGVDLLYFDPHAERSEIPGAFPGLRLAAFRTPRELERALADGAFQAVYSDIFFDWRISSAGKARFSSKDFEMGLEGAARTFERLLALCRLPFYARYAAHLPRPAGRSHD